MHYLETLGTDLSNGTDTLEGHSKELASQIRWRQDKGEFMDAL